MKTPTWDDYRAFLQHDDWTHDKQGSTDHDRFEKTLPDGEILQTAVSRGSKTISPGRFVVLLSKQLRVGQQEFWDVIRTKKPTVRPSPEPAEPPASHSSHIVRALHSELGLRLDEIALLDGPTALRMVDEARSRPRD